jgi:hypothetical protein
MMSVPTIFDLIATVLMNVGLLSVTASVYQMMRGAEMVFAAALAVMFLHRSLNRLHYAGIGACITGICVVGLSSVLSGEGGTKVDVTPGQVRLASESTPWTLPLLRCCSRRRFCVASLPLAATASSCHVRMCLSMLHPGWRVVHCCVRVLHALSAGLAQGRMQHGSARPCAGVCCRRRLAQPSACA